MSHSALGPSPVVKKKDVVKTLEVVQTYAAGDVIFSQGDRGGDLLFIEEGEVEIFIIKNSQNIPLARMGTGEIIGVMTFLTRDDRLASARAVLPTKIKRVPSQQVQKYIASFPKWLAIVLKEFVARINEMNRMYSEGHLELKKSRELQITPLFLATQMAQALGIVGRGIAKNQDGVDIAFADELMEKMQLVLNQPKDMIDSLFDVFHVAGLLKVEVEIKNKRVIYRCTDLDKVAVFTQFVRDSAQGSIRKILRAKLQKNEIQLLEAMAKHAIEKGKKPDENNALNESELRAALKTTAGIEFTADVLVKPAKIGLLGRSGEGPDAVVTFSPSALLQTLACVQAMSKLTGADRNLEKEKDEAGGDQFEFLETEELIPTTNEQDRVA